jgi:uncharacterized Zn ribbon protein
MEMQSNPPEGEREPEASEAMGVELSEGDHVILDVSALAVKACSVPEG